MTRQNTPNSCVFLAKAKAQAAKRRTEQNTGNNQGMYITVIWVWIMVNMKSDQQVSPMGPLRRTDTEVSISRRVLTSSGANREDREDTNDNDVPGTPRQSHKRTFQDLEDDEDENLEPGPSQRVHPSQRRHAANTIVTSIHFMTDRKLNEIPIQRRF